jgi:eukaryotic-like serine/threonine-protein kinase
MSSDPTQLQGGAELQRARAMSLERGHPPTAVPGYEPERFLGLGAYGEVWVAIERNTGRRVAIKFYAHRGGLDWSLLSREVEKLAFLFADRYVVQLLAVGWEAEPPYYVMEYLERGSLADRLSAGPLPVKEAVEIFRDVAIGLVHAHGKGVLHCDLKPANVLLDSDNKPRLADFGQSRLSHEQAPALGTLFYMAPEQADLEAVPDVRWDVYALGAVLYCMLTGNPPYRGEAVSERFDALPDVTARLAGYRELIANGPPPAAHYHRPGVDQALAEIVDRCLAIDPDDRFPNVQAVLAALDVRVREHARRPMMILGAVGPLLLLLIVSWFAWQGFHEAVQQSDDALVARALDSNYFAAQNVARTAADELERRYQAVERLANTPHFQHALAAALAKPELKQLLARVNDPQILPVEREHLRAEFANHPDRQALQQEFVALAAAANKWGEDARAASWFFCDPQGTSVVRSPEGTTIGKSFVWRSFFHGGDTDEKDTWRPQGKARHVTRTQLSDVFRSQATARWIVAISAPVYDDTPQHRFLGVLAQTAEVGRFIQFPGDQRQFAVLLSVRPGSHQGLIMEHPLLDVLLKKEGRIPDRLQDYRVADDQLPNEAARKRNYRDPMAADPQGKAYDRRWLAQAEPVRVRGEDTGWLVIVEESYDAAIGSTLDRLKSDLVQFGLMGLATTMVVVAGLWALVLRVRGSG